MMIDIRKFGVIGNVLKRNVVTVLLVAGLWGGAEAGPGTATVATIDADGGSDYTSLDAALTAMNNNSILQDTFLLTGNDIDTFAMTITLSRTDKDTLVIRSDKTNPDSFPVIIRNGSTWWNFIQKTNISFIQCVLEANLNTESTEYIWTNAQSADKSFNFVNCVIRNHPTKYFFKVSGNNAMTLTFNNCLITNTKKFLEFEFWNGNPTVSITNCTFEGYDTLFRVLQYQPTTSSLISIKNCIFGTNTIFYANDVSNINLKGKTTNCLLPTAISGIGSGCIVGSPSFISSSRTVPTNWQIQSISLAHNLGTPTSLTTDIGGYAYMGNPDAGCWEYRTTNFTWDTSNTAGFQTSANGTWNSVTSNQTWGYGDGTTRTFWRGAGNSATFAGASGSYTVTVSGTQNVDSLSFLSSTYTLSSGTLNFTTKSSVYVAPAQAATIASIITGTPGITKIGDGHLTISGANTFTGPVILSAGRLTSVGLGVTSSFGNSSLTATGVVFSGPCTLSINNSTNGTTTRLFTIGSSSGAHIANNGTGTILFSTSGLLVHTGTPSPRTLTLSGTNTGNNIFTPILPDVDGTNKASLTKSGIGAWVIPSAQTYTDSTRILEGTLFVNGTLASPARVATGAKLAGAGTINGNVTVQGTLAPGGDSVKTLTFGNNLTFSNTGIFQLGINNAPSDSFDHITVTGTCDIGSAQLSIALSSTYLPAIGTTFSFVSAGTRSGTFSNFPNDGDSLLVFNGSKYYYFKIAYSATEVTLTCSSEAKLLTWDDNVAAGFQSSSGTWSTSSNRWSVVGTVLSNWPATAGYTATFAGATNGSYTITVSGTPLVDSIAFTNSYFTLTGGTLNLGSKNGIYIDNGDSALISSTLSGTAGLATYGTGKLTVTADNTLTGTTSIAAGTLQIGNGGTAGSVPGAISNNGTLVFNRSNAITIGVGSPISGTGSLVKRGTGVLTLSAANTYSGATTIGEGTLALLGSLNDNSVVTVNSGAIFSGNGACGKVVAENGSTLSPGWVSSAKMSFRTLKMNSGTIFNVNLGTNSDTVAIADSLYLDGTINIDSVAGFTNDTFTLFTFNHLKNDTLVIGTAPAKKQYVVKINANSVDLIITPIVPVTQSTPLPDADSIFVDSALDLSCSATGTLPIVYKWYKAKSGTDSLIDSSTTGIFHKPVTVFSDSGRYYCILSNIGGTDTTDSIHIIVKHRPPVFTLQPIPDTTIIGSNAKFTALASGNALPSYAWYKTGKDSVFSTYDSLYFSKVTFADSGSYYCKASNPGGFAHSDTVKLAINHIAPQFTSSSTDTALSVYVFSKATFTVAATGNAAPLLTWYKKGSSDTFGSGTSLTIDSVDFSDSGSYYCIASNPGGKDTSRIFTLSVRHLLPKPLFSLSPLSGASPLPVSFTNTSSGEISSYLWKFGDGDTSSEKSPKHTYAKPGLYSVQLNVTGPGGTDSLVKKDSVFVYEEGSNPVRISARFIEGTSVEITFDNIDKIDTISPPPVADSIGLWIKPVTPPSLSSEGTLVVTLKRATWTGSSIKKTISLPITDSLVGMMSGIFWHDGSISPFKDGNGTSVLMRDTSSPVNQLTLSAQALEADSVKFTLGNIASVNKTVIDSFAIWFGNDTVSYASTGSNVKVFPVSILPASGNTSFVIKSNYFTGASRKLFAAVSIKGKNNKVSRPAFTSFQSVFSTTNNPLSISALAITSTKIRLTWPAFSAADVNNIIIWYSTVLIDTGSAPSGELYDSVTVPKGDTSVVITGLDPNTTYYFAGQISKSSIASPITEQSRATGTTPEKSSITDIENSLTIDTLYFDTSTGNIKLSWCVDEKIAREDLEVAITYSLKRYPPEVVNSQVVTLLSTCTDTTVHLLEPLRFDTLYHVALWLRQAGGIWLDHTESSRDTLRIGKPSLIQVSLFDPDKKFDTISIFNDNILLFKDPSFTEKTSPSITLRIPEIATPPAGTILVGSPIEFVKYEQVLPFFIGFKVTDLPKGYSIQDVRIYTDSSGILKVLSETVIDSVHSLVYIKTNSLSTMFLPLLDTVPPELSLVNSETAPYVLGTQSLRDTIRFSDNISNTSYAFFYGRGNEIPVRRISGVLDTSEGEIVLIIPDTSRLISSEYGLRAFLVISDGVHSDTINLSRSVLRSESDPQTTSGGQWTPLSSTARLLHDDPSRLVNRILAKNDTSGYDPRYLRLYRWISFENNKDSSSKWVEYDPDNEKIAQLFSLQPGKLLWIKTRENLALHLDSSYTLSLKDTFTIELPPGEWTDFGMPYRFSVPLSSIFTATGTDAESIDFCKWKQDDKSGNYLLEPLYIAGVPDHQEKDAELEFQIKGGYSFFNHAKKVVKLRIPPTLPGMENENEKVAFAKSAAAHPGWGISVTSKASSGEQLPELYIGFCKTIACKHGSLQPSFSSVKPSLYDRSSRFAHSYIIEDSHKAGFTREILFAGNSGETTPITLLAHNKGIVPDNFSTVFYNAALEPVSSKDRCDVPAHGTISVWMVTGDASYHAAFRTRFNSLKYALHAPYPNPARHAVTIQYSVPLGSDKNIYLSIYNLTGKRIWEYRSTGLHAAGIHTVQWNGKDHHGAKVGSGMYLLKLEVINSKGVAEKNFKQKITFFR